MSAKQSSVWGRAQPWVVSFFASLFFFYEFIQINMFNAINVEVKAAFQINDFQLGLLSSIFFYTTVAFILPAGQLLDRFSPRAIILVTMLLCVLGIGTFASADYFWVAGVGRLLEGIGSAFCFLGAFKVASTWFDSRRLSLIAGLIVTVGMLGGLVAQAPLTALVNSYGWRHALFIDAVFGLVLLLFMFFIVRTNPNAPTSEQVTQDGYWHAMKKIYGNFNNWLCGLYTCLMNTPFAVLGAIWGSVYLQQVHGVSVTQAANIIGWLFIGTIVGSPIMGWLASVIKSNRAIMAGGMVLSLLVFFTLMRSQAPMELSAVFFLLGLVSSSQILGYPTAAQANRPELSAMSASVVSFITMLGYIIFQPLFGWLLDVSQYVAVGKGMSANPTMHFYYAIMMIPVAFILAGICVLALRIKKYEQ